MIGFEDELGGFIGFVLALLYSNRPVSVHLSPCDLATNTLTGPSDEYSPDHPVSS